MMYTVAPVKNPIEREECSEGRRKRVLDAIASCHCTARMTTAA